jgi:drug/metabolite transporter (DMT)-like permease
MAALLASFGTAIVMLGLHKLRTIDPMAIVVHFSAVATVVCLGYAVVTSAFGADIDLTSLIQPATLALLGGVGAFATVGQIAMTRAFAAGSPQSLSVVFLSQVVFALGFDWAIWRRPLEPAILAGTILILIPVAWLLTRRPASTLTAG